MKMKPAEAVFYRKNARKSEKIGKTFGSVEKNSYLCTRIGKKVRWMSGLVYGLQNRPRRFESATHLQEKKKSQVPKGLAIFLCIQVKAADRLHL